jgi:hypothetical protein
MKLRLMQVHLPELRLQQIGFGQVYDDVWIRFAPKIPAANTIAQHGKLMFISHNRTLFLANIPVQLGAHLPVSNIHTNLAVCVFVHFIPPLLE